MKYYRFFLLPIIALSILSCSNLNRDEEGASLALVEIGKAIQAKQNVLLSEIVESDIDYVSLESGKDHLLGTNAVFYHNDEEIIALTRKQIFIFDRVSGKFLREIGHYGNDPGGYKKVVKSFPYDHSSNIFYTKGWGPKSYFRYNSNGELKDNVTAYSLDLEEDLSANIFGEMVTSIAPVNDTCFAGYVWNINGSQQTKLVVFNEKNHRIKAFPQYKHFDYDINKDGINVFSWEGWFYKVNGELNFYERFSDTIFTVYPQKIVPKFVLKQANGLEAPYTKRYLPDYDATKYFTAENIFETSNFLLFKVRQKDEIKYGFYNKLNSVTRVSNSSSGIINDIDNFASFKFHSAYNNEIIGSLDAYEIKEWFLSNPDDASKLSPKLQKLKLINENDNPVIMISKTKQK